jgi:prepilin-type N-terminal cleavage/methylation domain-containing protein
MRRGFSLLEVIVGAFIFSTVFAGFAATWVLQERAMRKYRDHNVARFLAQSEMERATARGFRGLRGYATGAPRVLGVTRKVDGVEAVQDFEVTVSLENATDISADVIVMVEGTGDDKLNFELRTTAFKTI